MDPCCATLNKHVVPKADKVRGLEEEEKFPNRWLKPRIVEDANSFDELAWLDCHTRTDREPSKNVESCTAVTL